MEHSNIIWRWNIQNSSTYFCATLRDPWSYRRKKQNLSAKDFGHCLCILHLIKKSIWRIFQVQFARDLIIVDFELAFINTFGIELTGAGVTRGHFHFCKNLFAKLKELSLAGPYQNNPRVNRSCQKRIAI